MRRAALLLAVLGLCLAGRAPAAGSAAALFNRGNQLYQAGKYEEARQAYEQAAATGLRNAELFYNLGNAELRSGRLGPAVAAYLRARRITPRDADVRFNLEYARARIKARLPDLPQGPLDRAWTRVAEYLSGDEWTLLALGAYWLAAAGAGGLILARRRLLRSAARWLFYSGLAVLVCALPFTAVKVNRDYLTPRGVILADKVTARSGPGEENAALFELYEGMDVVVGQCQSGWCRVSPPGFIGWIAADKFERI